MPVIACCNCASRDWMSCNNVLANGSVFTVAGRAEASVWLAVKSCGVISCSVATASVNCAPDDVVTSLAAAAMTISVLALPEVGVVAAGVTVPGAAAEEASN